MGAVFLELFFQGERTSAHRIACVEDLNQHVGGVDHFVELIPDTPALAGGHALVSIFGSTVVFDIFKVVVVFLNIVLLAFNFLDQFLHITDVELDSLPSAVGSKGVSEGFDLKKSQFVLLDGFGKKRGRDFFGLDEDLSRIFFLSCHLDSQFFERFLIDGADITEPFTVGIDSCGDSGSFVQLLK
jgi:hypothetical protein